MKPLKKDAGWFAVLAGHNCPAELQAFYEANPQYWQLTHGRPPTADAAKEGLDSRPPDDMPYTDLLDWLIRDADSGRLVGQVSVATDLLAPGVTHLGFFIVETARHGNSFANDVYAAYEAWAITQGARWLRLGVVQAHPRAHRFWIRQGYVEVCRRSSYQLGERRHNLLVMVKSIAPNSLAEYLERVPRDRASVGCQHGSQAGGRP